MPEIQATARSLEKLSREHLETHETFEGAATMFHIAIAIVAVSVVARRKEFWMISMAGGAVGLFFLTKAFIYAPPALDEEKEAPGQAEHGASGAHESKGEKPAGHGEKKSSEEPKEKSAKGES